MIARKPYIALFFYVCLFGTIGNALNIKASAQQYRTPADCLEMESIFHKCLGRDKKVYKDRISYCIQKPGESGCKFINKTWNIEYVDPDEIISLRLKPMPGIKDIPAMQKKARAEALSICENMRNEWKYAQKFEYNSYWDITNRYISMLDTRLKFIDTYIHPDDRKKAKSLELTTTRIVMGSDCR